MTIIHKKENMLIKLGDLKTMYNKATKTFFALSLSLFAFLTELFAHKTTYQHNHGGGGPNTVPEIDGNYISIFLTILASVYILFVFSKNKKVASEAN